MVDATDTTTGGIDADTTTGGIDADTTTGGIDADTTTGGIDADTTTGGIDDQRLRAKNTSEYFCIESTRPTTTTKGGIVRKIND